MIPLVRYLSCSVNTARTCNTCAHRSRENVKLMGMRCLHPRIPSTEPIYGLPPLCSDVREGLICGPDGALHSSLGPQLSQ